MKKLTILIGITLVSSSFTAHAMECAHLFFGTLALTNVASHMVGDYYSLSPVYKQSSENRMQYLQVNQEQIGSILYDDSYQNGIVSRYISYLKIDNANMRGHGIGTQCMHQFIKQSEDEGVNTLKLISGPKAVSFYENLHFKADREPYSLIMKKELNPLVPYKPLFSLT